MLQPAAAMLFALLLWVTPSGVESSPASGQADIVTGVLEEVDLKQLKGKIRTDLGKPIFFKIVKPELFQRIHPGDRVTVQLDERGRAIKLIEVPAPELQPS
jgi:hypothetical protein